MNVLAGPLRGVQTKLTKNVSATPDPNGPASQQYKRRASQKLQNQVTNITSKYTQEYEEVSASLLLLITACLLLQLTGEVKNRYHF